MACMQRRCLVPVAGASVTSVLSGAGRVLVSRPGVCGVRFCKTALGCLWRLPGGCWESELGSLQSGCNAPPTPTVVGKNSISSRHQHCPLGGGGLVARTLLEVERSRLTCTHGVTTGSVGEEGSGCGAVLGMGRGTALPTYSQGRPTSRQTHVEYWISLLH